MLNLNSSLITQNQDIRKRFYLINRNYTVPIKSKLKKRMNKVFSN